MSSRLDRHELVIEFTWTIHDHLILDRYRDRELEKGRREQRSRTIGTAVTTGLVLLVYAALAYSELKLVIFLLGLAAIPLMGYSVHVVNEADLRRRRRTVIVKLIEDAHVRAIEGRGPVPLVTCQLVLEPLGYVASSERGTISRLWGDFSRVAWFEGSVFVHKDASRVDGESVDLLFPSRAFDKVDQAIDVFETIQEWHTRARATA